MLLATGKRVSLLSCAALLACASAASAITIYAPDNLGTTNSGSIGDRIIRFDSANPVGTVVVIGSAGAAAQNRGLSGMDFAGNGTLYAVSGFNSDGTAFGGSQLFSISTVNGAATLIGNCGLPAGYAATDLSWNPTTGQMQMIAANGTANPGQLYTVSLATGAAALVGNINLAGSLDIGLATSSTGQNYLHDIVTDRMYTLTGLVATPMAATIGFDTNFSQGMTINWSGANEWFLGSLNGATLASQVWSMNLATGGTSALLGTWPTNVANGLPQYETGDLAIPPVVPEPASIGLLGISLGAMAARRRR